MRTYEGQVIEIQGESKGSAAAWIACPEKAVPVPGQYLWAWSLTDEDAVTGTALFQARQSAEGFLAVPPVPRTWEPGTRLHLRGPLGHGFDLPRITRRLALVAAGQTVARLLPLAHRALQSNIAVALFTDASLPDLPSALEASPLHALPESLAWPDFLALDIPLENLSWLRQMLGMQAGQQLPCPGQALVLSSMPCAGLAQCGACAIPGRRAWKLACKDGPVFDVNEIEW